MKRRNTLLKKIILLFVGIFIPFTFISTLALSHSNQKLKEQVFDSINSNTASYISQLGSILDNIYISSFNFINQSYFLDFSTLYPELSPYEKRVQVKQVRKQIASLCLTSPFVETAHVYFKNLGVAYNPSSYLGGSYTTISAEETVLLESVEENGKLLHYYPNSLTKKDTLALLLSPESSSDYCASVVLSQKELKDYFAANATYEGEHYLLASDSSFELTTFDSDSKREALALRKAEDTYVQTSLNGTSYYVFSYPIAGLSATYMRFIPVDSILKNVNTAPLLILWFFLFVFGACILFFFQIYRLVHKPLVHLTSAFEEVEQGNFHATITDYDNMDFAYLYHAFNNMTQKLDQLIDRDYNQKLLFQKAELKQLQAQINPHFLYNSFFMLQRMIKMESLPEAREMSNALGSYFHYLTRNSMDQVTLAEEYEHAKIYAYIQQLRFAGRIKILFEEIPDGFTSLPTPKLILQPILENAFNYGLANKAADGLLEVHFTAVDHVLTVTIEENGNELTDEALHSLGNTLEHIAKNAANCEMTGLLNIQRRLTIFSDASNSLHVSRSSLGGLCVSIVFKNNDITEV